MVIYLGFTCDQFQLSETTKHMPTILAFAHDLIQALQKTLWSLNAENPEIIDNNHTRFKVKIIHIYSFYVHGLLILDMTFQVMFCKKEIWHYGDSILL